MGKTILIALIHLYQKAVSPIFTPSCRFYPSCSEYAVQAIEKYGTAQGLLKAILRVLRCNPYHKGGFDPV
ncbi:MAG TPA: membrane protein insertion efficiency factor YidD [Desulfomonilia bacterium]|nr:membrane protein insertion efficiency factor YidD [Desulfomonilia bacterium]